MSNSGKFWTVNPPELVVLEISQTKKSALTTKIYYLYTSFKFAETMKLPQKCHITWVTIIFEVNILGKK